jgi:hypothetical protein
VYAGEGEPSIHVLDSQRAKTISLNKQYSKNEIIEGQGEIGGGDNQNGIVNDGFCRSTLLPICRQLGMFRGMYVVSERMYVFRLRGTFALSYF